MPTLKMVLVIVSLVLLLLAALGVPSKRVSLGWLGLLFAFIVIFMGKVCSNG